MQSTLDQLFKDKTISNKAKTEHLSEWLLKGSLDIPNWLAAAERAKDPVKASLIEAMEFASKQTPGIADEKVLQFVSAQLEAKAPRIKWESAKVIGNIAHLFPDKLETAIALLLKNAEDEGTVVRWSAGFALGEILKLKTPYNAALIPAVKAICEREEKNSIRKFYTTALKKIGA